MDSFWIDNPSVLLKSDQIYQLWPTKNLSFPQKLNAITRLIILLSCVSILFTESIQIFVTGVVCIFLLVLFYHWKKNGLEGFQEQLHELEHEQLKERVIEKENPFHNVLVNEYGTKHPGRKPIEQSDVKEVYENVKENVIEGFESKDEYEKEDLNDKLFKNLGDNFAFEQTMRNYISNPNTDVTNAQNEFAKYCFGEMKSIKEDWIHPN